MVRKKWTKEAEEVLEQLSTDISTLKDFNGPEIKKRISRICWDNGVSIGKIMPALRLVLTGGGTGPDLMRIMEILGKGECEKRIDKALKELKI
jgi:glutamyl-tRNA synthetase